MHCWELFLSNSVFRASRYSISDMAHLVYVFSAISSFVWSRYLSLQVGNPDFAHWVDLHCPERITRIINQKDPVGIVPGQFLGYEHVAGEIHITDGGWVKCAGNDNPSKLCATGDTASVFDAEGAYFPGVEDIAQVLTIRCTAEDHNGPFDGVKMGCPFTS